MRYLLFLIARNFWSLSRSHPFKVSEFKHSKKFKKNFDNLILMIDAENVNNFFLNIKKKKTFRLNKIITKKDKTNIL